jgi:hypothetical protein
MKNLARAVALAAVISTIGVAPCFAIPSQFPSPPSSPPPSSYHGAPGPEMGASVLGMLMAGGIAAYVVKRRRK